MKPKWSFTVFLMLAYLGVFHLWKNLRPEWIIETGLVASVLLSALLIAAARNRHFVNFWDGVFHAAVILDIFLEGVLIRSHDHVGFYLCAAAFTVVLVGYRLWLVPKTVRT